MTTTRHQSTNPVATSHLLADGVTPIAAFAALRSLRMEPAFLFESAPGAGQTARHSIIGLGARGDLIVKDCEVQVRVDGSPTQVLRDGDPLSAARELLRRLAPSESGHVTSPFLGAYGAAAYEFARCFE